MGATEHGDTRRNATDRQARLLVSNAGRTDHPAESARPENQTNGSPDTSVARLTGKLSLETVHGFLCRVRWEPASYLVLDLSGVSFLDSAGVGALVSLFMSRRSTGKRLALAAVAQQGIAVLEVSGLLRLLPLYASVDLAIRQFRI